MSGKLTITCHRNDEGECFVSVNIGDSVMQSLSIGPNSNMRLTLTAIMVGGCAVSGDLLFQTPPAPEPLDVVASKRLEEP